MATFLELCQMVARESGTISGNLPSSVVNQTGRLAKVVHWTADAWRQLQLRRNAWLFMRGEFDGTTTAGAARYTGASFSIDRFGNWITEAESMTCYRQGALDEGEWPLRQIDWQTWRRTYDRGVQQQNRPLHYAISPKGELCLGPVPDGAYVVRGEYRKRPQVLAENGDVPDMPARFHDAIAWYALLLLSEHDEAQFHVATAMRRYRTILDDLERDQLPQIVIGLGGSAIA